jgi:hypothetical protein
LGIAAFILLAGAGGFIWSHNSGSAAAPRATTWSVWGAPSTLAAGD